MENRVWYSAKNFHFGESLIILNNRFLFEYILKCNLFPWCKAEFSATLLQSSVSHDPSEIIIIYLFAAKETFLIIINVENNCAALCGNSGHSFIGFFDE